VVTSTESAAFAELLQRLSFAVCESLSNPAMKEQPYLMLEAAVKLQRAFAAVGIAPR
jgi:hypothetical protein